MIRLWCRRLQKAMSNGSSPSRCQAARKPSCRPRLEALEDRLAPAQYTWTGLGSGGQANAFWSNRFNWAPQQSPAGDPAADLVFPASSLFHNHNFDDIPNLSVNSLRFTGTFTGNGYVLETLNGSSLFLGPAFGGTIASSTTGQNTITLNIQLAGSNTLPFVHSFSVAAGGTLSLTGRISGGGTRAELHKSGPGVLLPSAVNTYQGATIVDEGELRVNQNNQIPSSSAVTVNSLGTLTVNTNSIAIGSLAGNGKVVLGGANLLVGGNDASTTFSGVMSGQAGFVVKQGSGTWTLAGVNTYTTVGRTVVSGGTLQIGISQALRYDTPLQVDATLDVNGFYTGIGSLSGSGLVTLGTGVLDTGSNGISTAFSGVITSASSTGGEYLVKRGSGTFTLSGANTYSGQTALVGGTLKLGAANALPSTTRIAMVSATLDLNGFDLTIGSLDGAGGVTILLGSGTLTTGGDNSSTTFIATISGTGGLTKTGTGDFTIAGNNTYSGPTTILQGTLVVNGSIAGRLVDIQGGGTLAGTGTINADVQNAGQVIVGDSTNVGILTINGNYTQTAAGTLVIKVGGFGTPGIDYDQLVVTAGHQATLDGAFQVTLTNGYTPSSGDSVTVMTFDSATGTFAALTGDGPLFSDNYGPNDVTLVAI